MKHLIQYNNYDPINEKITWKDFLVMVGLSLGANFIGSEIKLHNQLNRVYHEVNSTQSDPRGEEKSEVEKVRNDVIINIQNSELFKKFGKQYVIDSIKSVHFKILDDVSFLDSKILACYIHLPLFKEAHPIQYKYTSEKPSLENVIIVRRNALDEKDYAETITHELYHYLDNLVDYKSKKVDMSKFIDDRVATDDEYAFTKMIGLLAVPRRNIDKESNSGIKETMTSYIKEFKKQFKYLSSNSELFARWKTFKSKLLELGYIKDINQTPTIDDVSKYLAGWMEKGARNNDTDMDLLLVLDFYKLGELDKMIK